MDLDGTEVTITNPDKVYFEKSGHTKLDVVRFYESVSGPLLDALGGRPLLLERYPEGAGGKSFFQKRVPKSAPPWLQTTVVSTPNGTTSDALVAADLAHIAWAVNLGCICFHVWPYLAASPEHTDQLRIDLDPSPGIGFDELREGARLTKALLDELGISSHVKTSGSRGLHIYATLEPRWDGFEVRAAAVALARELERRHPDLITAKWWKEERGSRVFVDFNQNAPHKTVFGAWCIRPRVGGQVSTPIAWDDLDAVVPDELTIDTVADRVAEHGNPWADVAGAPQSIAPLLEMSAKDMAGGLMDAPWPPVYPKMPNEPPRVAPSRAKKSTVESEQQK
ncbi:MAG: non-homologous end-joining DNA ligase [Rhodococcus fascians]